MDGRGRAFDNIFIERFWRMVKYEEVYIKEYQAVIDAYSGLKGFIKFNNDERLHQSLGYKSPSEVHHKNFRLTKMGIGDLILLEEKNEGRKLQALPFLLSRNMKSYTLKIMGFCPNEVIHFNNELEFVPTFGT